MDRPIIDARFSSFTYVAGDQHNVYQHGAIQRAECEWL